MRPKSNYLSDPSMSALSISSITSLKDAQPSSPRQLPDPFIQRLIYLSLNLLWILQESPALLQFNSLTPKIHWMRLWFRQGCELRLPSEKIHIASILVGCQRTPQQSSILHRVHDRKLGLKVL